VAAGGASVIRKAKISDVAGMYGLISFYADREEMLPRSLMELYAGVRDFFVAEADGKVVGCAALHIMWDDLAEIKSLAVAESYRGRGLGRQLTEACLADVLEYKVKKVFVLTDIPAFFEKFRFKKISRSHLPRMVWADCIKCPRFPDCGEIPMVLEANHV